VRLLRALCSSGPEFNRRYQGNRNSLRSERGGALIEMAISFPILVIISVGLIEICLAFYTHAYISELAREGSRYAMLHGPTCVTAPSATSCKATAAQVNAYVSAISLPNLGGGTMTPSTTFGTGGQVVGGTVVVTVTYTFPFRVPFLPSKTLNMSSASTMTIVQ
jgi:Flp pilus assembly protein TadG